MNDLRIIRRTFLSLILTFATERVQVHACGACAAPDGTVGSSNETLDAFLDLIYEKLKEFQRQDDYVKQKLVVTALIAVVLVWNISHYWNKSTMSKRFGMPVMHSTPQGPSYPFLGQAINFLRYRPWDILTNWHRLYGPIVCFNLLGATMFSIASPDLLKVVLQSKIAVIKKDIANTMKPFLSILGTGIVTSEDESWMKQRLKMSNLLRRDVLEIIPRQTLLAVQRLMKIMDQAADAGRENTIPLGSSLRHLTLQVISGSFLSLSAEESDSTFAEMYLPIVDESNSRVWHPYRSYLFFLPSFWKYISNVRRLNQYVSKLIRDRWTLRRTEHAAAAKADTNVSSREHDILDRVLQVYEKEFPDKQVLPESAVRQFRDEMKTFMLAGHETSAAMMSWTLYELMGNSELMQRVADEGDSVFGSAVDDWQTANASDLPVPDDVARLVLAEASLKESLRKYSVVPVVARRTIQDLHMEGGYFIPKGSSLLINIQAVHHDPEIWPKPMTFDPSRFLPGAKIEPFTFLPFIAGPRNCLGQHLALLESKMVVGMLAQRYHFSLPVGKSVQMDDWSGDKDPRHRYMVPVIPKDELVVHVSRK